MTIDNIQAESRAHATPVAETLKRPAVTVPAKPDWIILTLLVVITTCIEIYFSSKRSVWFDESISINMAYAHWGVWFHSVWGFLSNMALYYLVLRVWVWITNSIGIHSTEIVVRLPSVIFAALSTVALYQLGRKFVDKNAALLATVVFSFSFDIITYAQETRAYSFHILTIILGYYCLFAAITTPKDAPSPRWLARLSRQDAWWGCYALVMGLAVYVHLISVTYIAAQACTCILLLIIPSTWRESARNNMAKMGLGVLGAVVIALPILYDAHKHGGGSDWIPIPTLTDFTAFYTQRVLGYNNIATDIFYAAAAIGVIFALLFAIPPSRNFLGRFTTALPNTARLPQLTGFMLAVVCWLFVPALIAFIVSLKPLNQHLFFARYQIAALPAICLLVGVGANLLLQNVTRVAFIALILFFAATNIASFNQANQDFYYSLETPTTQTHNGMAWIKAHYQSSDGIICLTDFYCATLAQYYLNEAWSNQPGKLDPDSPGGYAGHPYFPFNPVSVDLIAQYSSKHPRVFVIEDFVGQASIPYATLQERRQWLAQHRKIVDSFHTNTFTVTLYENP